MSQKLDARGKRVLMLADAREAFETARATLAEAVVDLKASKSKSGDTLIKDLRALNSVLIQALALEGKLDELEAETTGARAGQDSAPTAVPGIPCLHLWNRALLPVVAALRDMRVTPAPQPSGPCPRCRPQRRRVPAPA